MSQPEAAAATRWSLEDWVALPEDEPGELVDGRLEEEEAPDYVHELLVMLLGRLLGNWIFRVAVSSRDPTPSSPSAPNAEESPT